jgi:peptidoglycan/xylan/chitin deacetylase (PgdA/CDA1 family)
VPLRELVDETADRRSKAPAVAITFDDGYHDVLTSAVPLLEQHEIPATVFLIADSVGSTQRFWWDELAEMLLLAGELPSSLELHVDSVELQVSLGDAAEYRGEDFARWRDWRPWVGPPPTERQSAYIRIWEALQRLPPTSIEIAMHQLRRWAGSARVPQRTRKSSDSTPASVTIDRLEALALAEGGLVEVGAHTMTHPSLSALDDEGQRGEIELSKSALESWVGSEVASFSYPYGRKRDYNEATVALVKRAGFRCACAGFEGLVTDNTDPFQMPRVHVPNLSGAALQARLASLFAAA